MEACGARALNLQWLIGSFRPVFQVTLGGYVLHAGGTLLEVYPCQSGREEDLRLPGGRLQGHHSMPPGPVSRVLCLT